MKPVTQEHGFGCGIACVAVALDCSYAAALKKFRRPERAWMRGFTCRELAQALGTAYGYCYLTPGKRNLTKKNGSIVFIARSKKYPAGHYLIRTPKGWMNPWINFPRIHPVESGFQNRLPGRAVYAIYKKD